MIAWSSGAIKLTAVMDLRIKPLSSAARAAYADHGHFHEGDAGLDLFVLEEITIRGGATATLHLGIQCQPMDGKAYFLLPRSSISRTPLRMANSVGLIDGGYRGEIMAVVDNIKREAYTAHPGDRLFQLVATDASPIRYQLTDELDESSRGDGGFGSTGR